MNFLRETETWLDGLQRLIESPKTTATAAGATATAGVAMAGQWLNTTMGWAAVAAGIVATMFLARVHWFKGEQHRLEVEHQRMENEILRRKAKDLGIEIEDAES